MAKIFWIIAFMSIKVVDLNRLFQFVALATDVGLLARHCRLDIDRSIVFYETNTPLIKVKAIMSKASLGMVDL
jgi:hypothetical protein